MLGKKKIQNKNEKKTKSKRIKKSKKNSPIDWATDEYFDPNRVMVYVECSNECPIYEQMALDLIEFLKKRFTNKEFLLILNRQQTPRIGAFEISVAQNAKLPEELVWSGIDRGPPRKEKFPRTWENIAGKIGNIINKNQGN